MEIRMIDRSTFFLFKTEGLQRISCEKTMLRRATIGDNADNGR